MKIRCRKQPVLIGALALMFDPFILFAQGSDELVIYDTVVRRAVTSSDIIQRSSGPVATFDTRAFRGEFVERGPAADPQADQMPERPVVLPREFIDWKSGLRSAGPLILDDFYFDSVIDQGASYGYQTIGYTFDVTCRTVTTLPADSVGSVSEAQSGRGSLMRTRTGFSGTIVVSNLSCLVDLSCNTSSVSTGTDTGADQVRDVVGSFCLTDEAADDLFASILECDEDGLCYQIEETVE